MKTSILLIITVTIASSILHAGETYYPNSLLYLNKIYSHHVVLVEKNTHKLFLYKNDNNLPKLINIYSIVTGKKTGNKIYQGDYRTPEGVYKFTNFLPHSELLKKYGKKGEIYGVGAFVTNYPNAIDLQLKKSGSGIWLHSTNDETRIDKGLDSRGCVVSTNSDLIEISKYLELANTPIVITHENKFISKENWLSKRQKILQIVKNWSTNWSNKDFNKYISHYHKNFTDPIKGNLKYFSRYKKRIFASSGNIKINLSNLSILSAGDYISVSFEQEYITRNIQDTGLKTLYLKKDEYYNFKIIAETWTKKGLKNNKSNRSIAFEPSLRFFETSTPSKIMKIENEKL